MQEMLKQSTEKIKSNFDKKMAAIIENMNEEVRNLKGSVK